MYAIRLWNSYGPSVITENNLIDNYYSGILIHFSPDNNTITGNNIIGNNAYGIWIESDNNTLSGNIISDNNRGGILLTGSDNNDITGNNITGNLDGILLDFLCSFNSIATNNCSNNKVDGIGIIYGGLNNKITNNSCYNNMKGIALRGNSIIDFFDDIVLSWDFILSWQFILYLFIHFIDYLKEGHFSWLPIIEFIIIAYIVNSLTKPMFNEIIGNDIKNNHQGILLNSVFKTDIRDNSLTRNGIGIYLYESTFNSISNNIIDFNGHKGITLRQFSWFNSIKNNEIGPFNYQGIYIEKSIFNDIQYNNVSKNNDDGIGLVQTKFNRIHQNNIVDNTDHAVEGFLCFDYARNNYWGHNPVRWNLINEICDIYTPGGFVAIRPFLDDPVDIAS
jgi:parallel beta-helix repeat protein